MMPTMSKFAIRLISKMVSRIMKDPASLELVDFFWLQNQG
jgi:hypothetical protein